MRGPSSCTGKVWRVAEAVVLWFVCSSQGGDAGYGHEKHCVILTLCRPDIDIISDASDICF